jgi:hypothetical protein
MTAVCRFRSNQRRPGGLALAPASRDREANHDLGEPKNEIGDVVDTSGQTIAGGELRTKNPLKLAGPQRFRDFTVPRTINAQVVRSECGNA